VTLAECRVHPYRLEVSELQQGFFDLIVNPQNTEFAVIDAMVASRKWGSCELVLADPSGVVVGC
jgi:hypothetical protein